MQRTTEKQSRILAFFARNPGATTADLHRAIGKDYAHGHHEFTYASVDRLLRANRLERCASISGRGVVLRLGPVLA